MGSLSVCRHGQYITFSHCALVPVSPARRPQSADMNGTIRYDTPTRRIDPEQYEHSPSTGAEEITRILHAPNAHAVDLAEVSS